MKPKVTYLTAFLILWSVSLFLAMMAVAVRLIWKALVT